MMLVTMFPESRENQMVCGSTPVQAPIVTVSSALGLALVVVGTMPVWSDGDVVGVLTAGVLRIGAVVATGTVVGRPPIVVVAGVAGTLTAMVV
jgi:hypothetical protein